MLNIHVVTVATGRNAMIEHLSNTPAQMLAVPLNTACRIVEKLREYESADLADAEEQTNPLDCENVDAVTEHGNDYRYEPVRQELESIFSDLTEDQQIDLVALMWLGRDNGSAEDWSTVREEAAYAHNARTALYLLGSPLASDFLEEGLSTLGFSCSDVDNSSGDATRSEA